MQVIGNPKTITKSKLGYKPKRVSDSPLKYIINLTEKNDKINPELEENYVSFDAEVYSIRRGFLNREICNDLLIPKWNKQLPILFTEWNYYREIAVSEAFVISLHTFSFYNIEEYDMRREVPFLWRIVPCLIDVRTDDIVMKGVRHNQNILHSGFTIEMKVSVLQALKSTKSDVIDINSLDGVWRIDRNCFEDWLHRGRLAIWEATAKRAILGLGDFEIDDNGVLYKLSAGRTGDFVVPDRCKKIEKGAILLTDFNCKVKFCDSVRACKTGIFDIAVYNPSGQMLTIELANLGYKVMAGVGNIIGVGLCIPNKKLTFGATNVMDKMLNPMILGQMREIIEKKKPKLNSRVEFLFELAEKEANKTT
ncbi:MAG: hypothetical protein LBM93_15575 [Oscillospiraceae bacterium]|nr:hypothetical protein [Oscillospiraceae bacterium]